MKRSLVKLGLAYVWVWIERLFSLFSAVISILAFVTYLQNCDLTVFWIQLASAMATVCSWKASSYDEARLDRTIENFVASPKLLEKKSKRGEIYDKTV